MDRPTLSEPEIRGAVAIWSSSAVCKTTRPYLCASHTTQISSRMGNISPSPDAWHPLSGARGTLAAEREFSYQTNLFLWLAVSWHLWDRPGSLWRSMTGIIERTTTHTKHSPNSELPQTEKQPVDHTRIENPGINVVTLHGTCCFSL